ncbi:MAG TPA: hypothetical protein VFV34_13790 [Blastocatellia bacterium]|nr:hypothetical protein [Blastocatellia bacterium]
MKLRNINLACTALLVGAPLLLASSGHADRVVNRNSWRGLTPLHSTTEDVAHAVGVDAGSFNLDADNPFKVDGGDVVVSFISVKTAKIYGAPRSMVGKVFTIYFKPEAPLLLGDLKLPRSFRRCSDQLSKAFYYLVSDEGLAYRFRAGDKQVESVIYQPTRAEVRRLAVSTDCVF